MRYKSVIHFINLADIRRGGAQKILNLLLDGDSSIISLDSFGNKNIGLLSLYIQFIFYSFVIPKNTIVIIHSRCFLPLIIFFSLNRIKTIFYAHACYRSKKYLLHFFRPFVFVAVSHSVFKYLVDLGVHPKLISVIPNPFVEPDVVSIEFPSASNFNLFSSVGALEPWKGFLQCAAMLNNYSSDRNFRLNYRIVGEGSLYNDIFSANLNLNNVEIDLLGYLQNPFLALHDSPFFIISSFEEGFGLVAIEAIYFNKIIIYSNIPALVEICGDDCFSLPYDVNHEESFFDAIDKARRLYLFPHFDIIAISRKKKIIDKYSTSSFYKSYYDLLLKI